MLVIGLVDLPLSRMLGISVLGISHYRRTGVDVAAMQKRIYLGITKDHSDLEGPQWAVCSRIHEDLMVPVPWLTLKNTFRKQHWNGQCCADVDFSIEGRSRCNPYADTAKLNMATHALRWYQQLTFFVAQFPFQRFSERPRKFESLAICLSSSILRRLWWSGCSLQCVLF